MIRFPGSHLILMQVVRSASIPKSRNEPPTITIPSASHPGIHTIAAYGIRDTEQLVSTVSNTHSSDGHHSVTGRKHSNGVTPSTSDK